MIKAADDQPVWHTIRKSEVPGNGVFARDDIPKGARILEYLGEKITKKESDRRGFRWNLAVFSMVSAANDQGK